MISSPRRRKKKPKKKNWNSPRQRQITLVCVSFVDLLLSLFFSRLTFLFCFPIFLWCIYLFLSFLLSSLLHFFFYFFSGLDDCQCLRHLKQCRRWTLARPLARCENGNVSTRNYNRTWKSSSSSCLSCSHFFLGLGSRFPFYMQTQKKQTKTKPKNKYYIVVVVVVVVGELCVCAPAVVSAWDVITRAWTLWYVTNEGGRLEEK